jgi:hypothetical protein
MQAHLLTKRIDPTRVRKLSPIGCEVCSEPATTEVLIDVDNITAVHRYCDTHIRNAEY